MLAERGRFSNKILIMFSQIRKYLNKRRNLINIWYIFRMLFDEQQLQIFAYNVPTHATKKQNI